MWIDEKKYLAERVEGEISWHDRRSSLNRKFYCRLQLLSMTCAALIPFISGFAFDQTWSRFVVGALGVVIAIIGGSMTLFQFQKLWIDYRVIAENLRGEKYRFQTKTAPYDDDDEAFPAFVETIEGTLNQQTARWQSLQKATEGPTSPATPSGGADG